jgi:hypothetical protein
MINSTKKWGGEVAQSVFTDLKANKLINSFQVVYGDTDSVFVCVI